MSKNEVKRNSIFSSGNSRKKLLHVNGRRNSHPLKRRRVLEKKSFFFEEIYFKKETENKESKNQSDKTFKKRQENLPRYCKKSIDIILDIPPLISAGQRKTPLTNEKLFLKKPQMFLSQ